MECLINLRGSCLIVKIKVIKIILVIIFKNNLSLSIFCRIVYIFYWIFL